MISLNYPLNVYYIFYTMLRSGKKKNHPHAEIERLKGFVYKSEKPRSEEEEDGDDDEIVRSKFHILYVGLLMGHWELGNGRSEL